MGRGGRVGIKDEFLNGNDLLPIAELLKLAKEGLDLVDQCFTLCVLKLTENLLCGGLAG